MPAKRVVFKFKNIVFNISKDVQRDFSFITSVISRVGSVIPETLCFELEFLKKEMKNKVFEF